MVAIVTALVVLAQALPATDSSAVIAAGRQIQAQLEQSVSARNVSANDTIVMSVSYTLLVGSSLALPAGTRIVAKVDSISHASASRSHLDLHMHLLQMAFADGDSIALGQSVLGKSSDGEWLRVENAHKAPQVIALASPVVGAAVGAARSGARGAVTGSAIGVVAGLFVNLIGAVHGRNLVAEKGAPIDLVLDSALVLDRHRLMAAEEYAAALPVFKPATKPRRCYVDGAPGSPDVTIPGTPPTPGFDGSPETPGTPTVTLPGTPAMPGSWEPC